MPCTRLSWPFRQLFITCKYTVLHRIVLFIDVLWLVGKCCIAVFTLTCLYLFLPYNCCNNAVLYLTDVWYCWPLPVFTCCYLFIRVTMAYCVWQMSGSVGLLYSHLYLSSPVVTFSSAWQWRIVCDRCLAVSVCSTSSLNIHTCTCVTWRLQRVCVVSHSPHTSPLRRPSTVVQVDWCASTLPDRWDKRYYHWHQGIFYTHCACCM